jgi:hypothetical protein
MYLHTFKGLDKNGNVLYNFAKFCKRPKATIMYKYFLHLLEQNKIDTLQLEKTEIYCSF